MNLAIRLGDIEAAAVRLSGHAVRTPLMDSAPLSERVGRRTLIKFEGAQHTGSFKFRGAYNRLAALNPAQRSNGVVAWSSGNHAQGVAAAARLLGMVATVVMPTDAPAVKIANTRTLGAEVVLYDRATQSREDIARGIALNRGAVLVPSYDDPHVIAGQGTAGLEIVEQAAGLQANVTTVLCCCGGGGLIAGLSTAVRAHLPDAEIWAVEPDGFDDTARSLASGKVERVLPNVSTFCDALMAPTPGQLTLPINRANLAGGLAVSDDEVRAAIHFAFREMKVVAEPGGAVALAAAIAGKTPARDGDVVILVSGSNIDPRLFVDIITDERQERPLQRLSPDGIAPWN